MSPKDLNSQDGNLDLHELPLRPNCQSLFIIRHGDRWDYENPSWLQETDRPGDPPLSTLGHQQARETGIFLDQTLSEHGVAAENITWLSSPFLRTLQTSNEMLNAFSQTKDSRKISILPEYSVFEWDGKGGAWHASLPPLKERVHYFPRLDAKHTSLFVPAIPEPRSAFLSRCDRAMTALMQRYRYQPCTAIVVVTHAAACVGLARAAARLTLQDIAPAAPCSIYQLTRSSEIDLWSLDAHDAQPSSFNGYIGHLSDLGQHTVPWNHFGEDKSQAKGYTGPPNATLAPLSR